MFNIKLSITGNQIGSEVFFEYLEYYLKALYGSKQIINQEWQFESIHQGVSVNLICLEKDAFKDENSTQYALKWRRKLEDEIRCTFNYQLIGEHPKYKSIKLSKEPSFLILGTNEFSPLKDGESFNPFPLYKLPYTYQDKACYNDINFWEKAYNNLLGLWFSGIGERWTQFQLQNLSSEINQQGVTCAKTIEEVSGIPTYYFLFNYRGWGQKKDKQRKCPGCGGDWYIKEKTMNSYYAFKCDPCRLVSELSSNS